MSLAYVLRRVVGTMLMVWAIATIVFVLLRVTNDPVASLVGSGEMTSQDIENVRKYLGLDRPIYVQYVDFLEKSVRGEFAPSFRYSQNSMSLVLDRFPTTVVLALTALSLALVVAIPLGIIAALRRNSWIDYLASMLAFGGFAIPGFWLGTMLVLIFAVQLRLVPTSGNFTPTSIILPAVTLAMFPLGQFTRLVRAEMLSVMQEDFIRTARAKGLRWHTVVIRHGLRNALLAVVTLLGLTTASLLAGAVVTETIFAWPGLGRLALQATLTRDFPLIEATVIFIAVVIATTNLVVDMTYSLLDPRIRHG